MELEEKVEIRTVLVCPIVLGNEHRCFCKSFMTGINDIHVSNVVNWQTV